VKKKVLTKTEGMGDQVLVEVTAVADKRKPLLLQ